LTLALIAAHLVELWRLPLPQCTTRSLTGVPCPFCGSTRTLMAAARGDFARAVALNPLTFVGLVAAAAWLIVRAAERLTGRRLRPPVFEPRHGIRWGALLAVALVANWIYLWRTLPP
jgi:hypothetical protein